MRSDTDRGDCTWDIDKTYNQGISWETPPGLDARFVLSVGQDLPLGQLSLPLFSDLEFPGSLISDDVLTFSSHHLIHNRLHLGCDRVRFFPPHRMRNHAVGSTQHSGGE